MNKGTRIRAGGGKDEREESVQRLAITRNWFKDLFPHRHRAVVLNQGKFCSPGHIWQCLEMFLIVMIEGWGVRVLLASRSC